MSAFALGWGGGGGGGGGGGKGKQGGGWRGDVGGRVYGFQMLLYELPETNNATWAGYVLVGLPPLPFHPHLAHFFICIGPQLS